MAINKSDLKNIHTQKRCSFASLARKDGFIELGRWIWVYTFFFIIWYFRTRSSAPPLPHTFLAAAPIKCNFQRSNAGKCHARSGWLWARPFMFTRPKADNVHCGGGETGIALSLRISSDEKATTFSHTVNGCVLIQKWLKIVSPLISFFMIYGTFLRPDLMPQRALWETYQSTDKVKTLLMKIKSCG